MKRRRRWGALHLKRKQGMLRAVLFALLGLLPALAPRVVSLESAFPLCAALSSTAVTTAAPGTGIGWAAVYGDVGAEEMEAVWPTSDGGYVVAGWTNSFGAGQDDFWVFKLDASGGVEWEYTYGGPGSEQAWSIAPTSDGGYLVAGGTTSFGAGGADLWALKLDAQGGILWQRVYGVPGYWDEALAAGAAPDGGALIGGYYEEGAQDWDLFLVRLDADGDPLWEKRWEYGWDWPNAVRPLTDGGFVVAGVAWPRPRDLDMLLLRLPPDGSLGASCPNLTDLSLVQRDTSSTPLPTNAVVHNTNVVPRPGSAVVQSTSVAPNYVCQTASGTAAAFRVTSQEAVFPFAIQ